MSYNDADKSSYLLRSNISLCLQHVRIFMARNPCQGTAWSTHLRSRRFQTTLPTLEDENFELD